MADISQELQAIMQAIYGEEVRGSIHDAIEKINDVSEVVLSAGTAVTSASSPTTGFYEDSFYLNVNTSDLWKCTGTAWELVVNLQGASIASVTYVSSQGLEDTYKVTLDNGVDVGTFTVTNGRDATGSTIASLDDVLLTSLDDKQILKYDGTAHKWKNVDETVSGLKDTNISTPTDRQIMEYDSTSKKWKNSSALVKTEEMIAPTETSPATNSHTIGDQIIYNDVLYDVILAIAVGDTLTVNTNIVVAESVSEQIKDLEADVSGLDADKAEKSDLASIFATGTTNATGSTISSGTYFYLNGTLVRAKADIASGATFTLNTNYEVISAGALNCGSLVSRPDLWTVGTEYDFGGGLYGQRFSGTFGSPTGSSPRLGYIYDTNVSMSKIVNSGGTFTYELYNVEYTINASSTFMNTDATMQTAGSLIISTTFNGLRIQLFTRLAYSALPKYDIWVLYKK